MNEPSPTRSAHTVGRYEVRSELGRGAMGVVYEAFDPVLHRLVALKTVRVGGMEKAQAQLFEERFLIEARIAARLQHPGIVVVHDVGREPDTGILFIALELLKGRTLQDLLNDGPLAWTDAVRLIARVAHALDHAHAEGVIHRDLKPANVMVLPSGEPKLMDFGIARVENAAATLSVPGEFIGTPLYASPEQALGQSLDKRSDIFSLGAVAYSALVGRSAFTASSVSEIVRKVIHVDPPPPSTQMPGLPPPLDAILGRALAKRPEDRYATAGDLARDLESVLLSAGSLTLTPAWPAAAMRDPLLELQTLVSDSVPGSTSPRPAVPGESDTRPPSPLPRAVAAGAVSRGSLPRRVLVAGMALVALIVLVLALRPAKQGTPAEDVTISGPKRAPEKVVEAEVPREEKGRSTSEAPVSKPSPSSDREARRAAVPSPAPRDSPQEAPSQLVLELSHSLNDATLTVSVDGQEVLSEKLSQKAKRVLGLTIKKGDYKNTIEVSPGGRRIRVRIEANGKTRTNEIDGTFFPRKTRRLEVSLGKNIDLRWK